MIEATDLPETLDLELDVPISVKGATYSVLKLKEPRAQQVRLSEQKLDEHMSEASVTAYQMHLVRIVADVPQGVVEALPVRKLGEAFGFLASFIENTYEGLDGEGDFVPPDNVDMPIEPPLTWAGGSYASLPLREPTAEELRKARGFMRTGVTPYTIRSYEMELLAMVTGLNPAIIHGLRIRTLTEASRHLALFIAAGRKAGKASRSN